MNSGTSAWDDIWVGVYNLDMVDCDDSGVTCDNKLYWDDGTKIVKESWMSGIAWDANDRLPCFRMANNGDVGDIYCTITRTYVCQLDCANIYAGK